MQEENKSEKGDKNASQSPMAQASKQYVRLNPREIHTEIQRRTKLLYGQQNLIHLLKKSNENDKVGESMTLFEEDIWYSNETDDEGVADNNAGPVE